MTQADTALNGGREIVPTGKSFEISRRSMLGAVAALPAMAAPAIVIAKETPFLASMRASRDAANAKFWRLHAEYVAFEEAWSAVPDDDTERENQLTEKVQDAAARCLMQPVFCPAAVLAKLKITGFDPVGYRLPGPIKRADQVIEWDLERCAKERQFHNPSV